MKVYVIDEPSWFERMLSERRAFPAPVALTRVKLREDGRHNHYLYIIEFGYSETYIHDSATDYSGTGDRFRREMDSIMEKLSKMFNITVTEMEMSYDLYTRLKNIFYNLWRGS